MTKQSPKFVPAKSNQLNERFINYIMKDGKKTIARKSFNDAFKIIEEKQGGKVKAQEVFEKAITNVSPILEIKPKRVGGAVYQVPVEVPTERKQALAMRWILIAARSRKGKPISEKLAEELLEAAEGLGAAVKKKDDVHRMAEANRAFAHFARF